MSFWIRVADGVTVSCIKYSSIDLSFFCGVEVFMLKPKLRRGGGRNLRMLTTQLNQQTSVSRMGRRKITIAMKMERFRRNSIMKSANSESHVGTKISPLKVSLLIAQLRRLESISKREAHQIPIVVVRQKLSAESINYQ